MHFTKFGFAALLLAICACDKPDDKMQSTSSMTSASAMAPTTMAPSAMAPSMGATGTMARDMGMAPDAGMMAPATGSMAAPAGSAPMMNDKKPTAPKMGASGNHM